MENERLRKIELYIDAIGTQALSQHHSPAAVAGTLADMVRLPLMSLLEEVDHLTSRVKELEDLVEIEGPEPSGNED